MPKYNTILNLPGFSIKKVSGFQPILFEVEYHRKPRCSHCNSLKVRKKDSYIREVKHEMFAIACHYFVSEPISFTAMIANVMGIKGFQVLESIKGRHIGYKLKSFTSIQEAFRKKIFLNLLSLARPPLSVGITSIINCRRKKC